jgi:hypothetical protein
MLGLRWYSGVAGWSVVVVMMVCMAGFPQADAQEGASPQGVAAVFTPLPLGEVKPAGWLRDWCQQAADGITGHSDELDPLFAKGWLDASFKASSTGAQGGDKVVGYAMEQAGYWVDGAVRLGHLLGDEALLAKCRVRFNVVLERVAAGDPPVTSKKLWEAGEKWGHWPMAVLGRAMLAEFTATGDRRYLDAIANIYADYGKYNKGGKFALIHHQGRQLANVEVMLEAYRLGGPVSLRDDAIKVLAEQESQIRQRLTWHEEGLARGKVDERFNSVPYGHAVTVNESMKVPAIAYLYSGDPMWLRFSEAGFEDFEKNEMMPFGLTSAHEHVGGIGPFSASELCNAVDYSWSATWMLRVTGSGVYADRVERAVFNAGASGIAPDFKTHQYFLASNRIDADHPGDYPVGGGPDYQPKHFPLCCTGNLSRMIPAYVMHLWMRTADGGLAATLHGPSDVQTTVRGVPIKLATTTDYPFRQTITTRVDPQKSLAFPLSYRVPAWCDKPVVEVNGKAITAEVRSGFAVIEREWKAGDTVRVSFPTKPRIITGKCADGAPFASVVHGPLLFALAIPHVEGNLNQPRAGAVWQYALDPRSEVQVKVLPMPQRWSWSAVPVELVLTGVPTEFGKDHSLPKGPVSAEGVKSRPITLVPFGTTAFRVSMFAVAR